MKARLVSEAINFERDQDPREAMGIGDEQAQTISKLDRLAKKYGFVETPFGPEHEEEGIENIKRWERPYAWSDDPVEVVLFRQTGWDYDQMEIYFNTGYSDGQDDVDGWLRDEPWEYHFGKLEEADIHEQIRFNFDKNPTDRFRVRHGESRPPVENPRKKQYGLTDEEEEIVQRHREKIDKLQERIDELEDDIREYKYEIEKLEDYGPDPAEAEQFDSEIIQRFGWNALDLLNSGSSKEEKINGLDRLSPKNDSGLGDFESIVRDYDYYHPPEPDNEEEIQGFQDQIDIREKEISEIEARMEKIYTKIHNLETY